MKTKREETLYKYDELLRYCNTTTWNDIIKIVTSLQNTFHSSFDIFTLR